MKKWVLRLRQVDRANFEHIASGLKSVETRAATIRYQPIQAGDILVFTCGQDRLEKPVKAVRHFADIDELFQRIDLHKGFPTLNSAAAAKRAYLSFPGYAQKIKEHGLLAFEL